MNTAQIEMTDQQEQKLESAIIVLAHREVIRMNTRNTDTYRVRKIEIREIESGDITLIMEFDNGKPGTLGYLHYSYIQLFVGKRGDYIAYSKKIKRVRGWKALYQIKSY
jgi:hypothetical protein